MKIQIHKKSTVPIYLQVSTQIAGSIQSGLLLPNEKLPSLRILAEELSISVLTVRKAYKWLETNGYVTVMPGKGVFISKKVKKTSQVDPSNNWQQTLGINIVRSQYLINREQLKYDFSKAVVYPRLLPNKFLADEMQKLLREDASILTTYGPVQGDSELRTEIIKHLYEFQKIRSKAENLIITSGVQQGIDLVAQALLKPGDSIIVESPCYGGALDIFINKGIHIIPVEMDEEGIRSDIIEDMCIKFTPKLIYVNPTFQNPTGISMSNGRRKELIELAQQYQFFILEDDSFSDIYFEKAFQYYPIKYYDQLDHVIYIKGFSKTLAPGVRIAAMLANGPVLEWLLAVKASMDVGSPLLTQKAILPFLRTDRMRSHVEKLRIALQIRRDTSVEILSSVNDQLNFRIPDGGFNLWVTFHKTNVDIFNLLRKANHENISFLPGVACFNNNTDISSFRISYSLVSENDLAKGLEKLRNLIKQI
ncbi:MULTISPECIES: PLP-dependent aminotransferase family protein [Bacillaceae]|uniref:GntR family transcriptional regulator n=1 Tax=Gottfriedia luciferensis TaxID=178774 RepID=A0ABX2ZJT3_9BACI|nr:MULTISPECIES: PLP-dependent aminotransferase family protein [Bacillaceae]ODG89938.1 GntR family transcriptional regulator [Gottfriedia luciferensis]SFD13443.1 DNA-binding transcriptional regulator, MocR family, contains an aminotransferase domain [Bacillus sp. UNCCL81]